MADIPERKSIRERMAAKPDPLVDSSIDLLDDTASFRVDVTGMLVADDPAPLPVAVERAEPHGPLDPQVAGAYHLLLLPPEVTADELEALAVSVWNEAGWLAPGVLQLLETATLDGPWQHEGRDAWVLRCPPRRSQPPAEEIKQMDELAAAFPDGMPVGPEMQTVQFLRQAARRLGGTLRIAGSGYEFTAAPETAVNLRIFSDQWLSPSQMQNILPLKVAAPAPLPDEDGAPYAFLADAGRRSQVLLGVRPETFTPRALRWEPWVRSAVFVYELVWVMPEDLHDLEKRPTRAGRLERAQATQAIEDAAAAIASHLGSSAIIDEDGFLLVLDEPRPEEEPTLP